MSSNKNIGDIGEHEFSKWCAQAGLFSNGALENDRSGWDFIVDFPDELTIDPRLAHRSEIRLKVQVKTTEASSATNNNRISLSNLRKVACDPLPSFYVFIEVGDDKEVSSVVVLHMDSSHINKILRRVVEVSSDGLSQKLNNKKMALNLNEGVKLERPYATGLRKYFEECVAEGFEEYVENKRSLLERAGFEDGHKKITFSLEGKEAVEKFVSMSLGSMGKVQVKNFSIHDQRFGIGLGEAEEKASGMLEFRPASPRSEGKVTIKKDKMDLGASFSAKLYLSNAVMMLEESERFFRIESSFFDLYVYPYKGKSIWRYSQKEGDRASLIELVRRYEALDLMNRPGGKYYIIIDFPEFRADKEQVGVDRHGNEVKEVLEALNLALHVCFEYKINPNVEVDPLVIYEQKNFLQVISSYEDMVYRVEFGSMEEDLDFEVESVSIYYLSVKIGKYKVGVILSLHGEIEETQEGNVRMQTREVKKEWSVVFEEEEGEVLEEVVRQIKRVRAFNESEGRQVFCEESL